LFLLFLTYIELTITLGMPLTKEEQLAQRRERDAVLRQEKREIIAQHPILLERISTLERQVLLLKIENEKLKNTNKDEKKPQRLLLDDEIEEIDHEVQEEILNIPPEPKVEKKVKFAKKVLWFEWIDRAQTKRIFKIPKEVKLDDDGFEKRARFIYQLLIKFDYETKDFVKDVCSMIANKKFTLEGLVKLFDIFHNHCLASEWHSLIQMIDKHDFQYAEKNHSLLAEEFGDDFTI